MEKHYVGEYILCKESFSVRVGNVRVGNVAKPWEKKFKKNHKYLIENINSYGVSNSGATYTTVSPSEYVNFYNIKGLILNDLDIKKYFYSKKELRKEKLCKLVNI